MSTICIKGSNPNTLPNRCGNAYLSKRAQIYSVGFMKTNESDSLYYQVTGVKLSPVCQGLISSISQQPI